MIDLGYMDNLSKSAEAEWRALGDISIIYGGLTGKSKGDFDDGNTSYVPYKNIFYNTAVDFDNLELVKVSNTENQREVKYGDVLFTGSSETPDEAGMSSAITRELSKTIYLNSFSFGLRFNSDIKINPHFSKHLFRSHFMRKEIIKTASGVTRFNISKARFKKIQIPIPPLNIQAEIVRILDAFTELTAELTAELVARKHQYAYYRKQLLTFNDDEVDWKTLKEVALELGRGKSRHRPRNDPKLYGGDVPLIQTGDIRNASHVINEYTQTYSKFGLEQSKLWPKGTLCITIAANIAETTILGFDSCFPDSIIGFVANPEKTTASYVEYLLTSFKSELQAKSTGSAQSNINLATFERIKFPFPSLAEQERIVTILDKFDALTTSLTEGLPHEIALRQQQYEYYRELLLSFPKLETCTDTNL